MHSIATELAIISAQLCYRASYAPVSFVNSVRSLLLHLKRFIITVATIIIVSLAIVVVLVIVLITIIIVTIIACQ